MHFQEQLLPEFPFEHEYTILNYIINIIQRNAEEAEKNKHPPTKKEALNKLKKFPMSDKYCKQSGKGKIELPNCCILKMNYPS